MFGMEQPPAWEATMTNRIGDRVRRLRAEQRMSAQALADECEQLGYPIPRSTIANLERGNRSAVPVQEVAILARALDVPPVTLLFDVGAGDTPVDIVPGESMTPTEAVEWWSGLPSVGPLKLARGERTMHQQAVRFARDVEAARRAELDRAAGVTDPMAETSHETSRETSDAKIKRAEYGLSRSLMMLRDIREEMERRDMTPPPIDNTIRNAYTQPPNDR